MALPDYLPVRQPGLECDVMRDATYKGIVETGRFAKITGKQVIGSRKFLTVKPTTADDYADLIITAVFDPSGTPQSGTGDLSDANPFSRARLVSYGGLVLALAGEALALDDEITIGAGGIVKSPKTWSYGRVVIPSGGAGDLCVLDLARRKL